MEVIREYSQSAVKSLLCGCRIGSRVCFYETTDSTNEQAKLEAQNGGVHGTLVVADRQTAGRGRRGRSWESPANGNIYFSLVLRPELAADKAHMLTLVMANSVARAIRRVTGVDCRIKWPNDIVADGRKVCGILTEMNFESDGSYCVIVGVGINVGLQEFPAELLDKAASLQEFGGVFISRAQLLAEVIKDFSEDYDVFMTKESLKGLLDSYQQLLINKDVPVRVLDPKGEYEGIARGITETGELLVETDAGVEQVYAGEVSVRGICGYV